MDGRAAIAQADGLDVRQKLCIFHETSVAVAEAVALDARDVTHELLVRSGVPATNLLAAGLGPGFLARAGAPDARALRQMGFDALHLVDARFVDEAVRAFGVDDVVAQFVTSAAAGVAVAGTEAQRALQLTNCALLGVCAGAPVEAEAVLSQLGADALDGVPASVVLDTGLRAQALSRHGYSPVLLAQHTGATPAQLRLMGFAAQWLPHGR